MNTTKTAILYDTMRLAAASATLPLDRDIYGIIGRMVIRGQLKEALEEWNLLDTGARDLLADYARHDAEIWDVLTEWGVDFLIPRPSKPTEEASEPVDVDGLSRFNEALKAFRDATHTLNAAWDMLELGYTRELVESTVIGGMYPFESPLDEAFQQIAEWVESCDAQFAPHLKTGDEN